ncbi:flavin reductase family protein [Ectobacillus sp. JY-23]|uniref:flavin reductase family protein n=1 Tax=Ectobacillus sp. JY-23 TaxID=2933872 RepID=UPI001FF5BB5A|nr:flavin reductase family protein [Ectobacillus sp. JY-23]UOY91220.1 flavin reductase family protein [Ectobacillus sp. JY-23]
MHSIDPRTQSERDNYKLLTGSIIPRPVAFVTTLSKDGVHNGAPFSYFNIVTANPPLISVSVQRQNGLQKDTARNAIETGAFVVHISDETYAEAINMTAAQLPPHESEIELAKLTPVPSEVIAVPGVQEASIRMECLLEQAIPLGDGPACDLLIGKVVRFHVAEHLYENGRINATGLRPISRLAGNSYAKLGEQFEIERP